MRALWSHRPNCSHNVSQKVKRIRRLSDPFRDSVGPESGKLRKFRENSGGPQWNSMGFCMAPNMNSVGIPWGFRGDAGFSEKFGVRGGFGRFGASEGFCTNSQCAPKLNQF